MPTLTKEQRDRCRNLVWKIAREWTEEDGIMSAASIRGKLTNPEVNPEHSIAVQLGTLKHYLQEGGIEYAKSQEIQKDRWGTQTKKKLQEDTDLHKECEALITKLNEQLETGEKDVDDLSRDMVARLYVISKVFMERAMKDGSVVVLKEAIKVYKDACNSTLGHRLLNNKATSIVEESEGALRLLDMHLKDLEDDKLTLQKVKVMTGRS